MAVITVYCTAFNTSIVLVGLMSCLDDCFQESEPLGNVSKMTNIGYLRWAFEYKMYPGFHAYVSCFGSTSSFMLLLP